MKEIRVPPDVYLEVIEGNDKGKSFCITHKTITIGRDPRCDFQITDKYVSAKHCQVVFRQDHFTIIDLNSLNKTFVNGEEYIQRNLEHGDVLSIGKTKILFTWKDQNALYKWY